ncbi:MAG: NADH-quinone oxidoreductase subunit L [Nitrospirae bacterium]|nr:NADH-quinone oxidoreductase subunit L [Candidatus Manganitrophaceae bacterium]
MRTALWLIPTFPLLSAVLLAIFGPRFSRRTTALLGVGSIALAALISLGIAADFLLSPPPEGRYSQSLGSWIRVDDLRVPIGFVLDPLSLTMILIVTCVGFLIHLYAADSMRGEEGYSRFFAYMNLFVAAMGVLVLADNFLLLYLGWEGVGLCSYLLIGFRYTNSENGRAARKAFIVTRVGDTALAIGLFFLFTQLGTLDIAAAMQHAVAEWPIGSPLAITAAALILVGAIGKSAQLPLQVWLPDAMAGPTPTSALIHAATMVTAGVYLIARTASFFILAPPVQTVVAVIGAATLLIAGFSALVQTDLKRVLAYSTISQIGYMFLALGVGAWSAAIFHLMTHAFFKALLFLSAGVVIHAMEGEQNLFRMGGLRRIVPLAFWGFLIGGASMAGLPLITAGFYSKGEILWGTWIGGGPVLWAAGVIGVVLTTLYTFRLFFLVFFGRTEAEAAPRPGFLIRIPLVVLSLLSIFGGFINLPSRPRLSRFLHAALPPDREGAPGRLTPFGSEVIVAAAFMVGLLLAYELYLRRRAAVRGLMRLPMAAGMYTLWYTGWGWDLFYDRRVVRPVKALARAARSDWIDLIYIGLARLTTLSYDALRRTETGRIRWYVGGIAAGTVLFIGLVLFI